MAGDVVSLREEELVGKLDGRSPKLNLPNNRLIGGSPKKKTFEVLAIHHRLAGNQMHGYYNRRG